MKLNNYIVCKDILAIRTNAGRICWSFGQPPQFASDSEVDACRIVMKLIVNPLRAEAELLQGLEKYHYWRGTPGRDELFYQRNFFCGTKLRLLVRGLQTDRPEIWTNRNYLRFIRFRFNNLHSPGYQLTDLACALLLTRNLTPLHCSGFHIGNSTVAVIAPPDTGKTLTTMGAVLHNSASFISEDLGITDGVNFYACPWTSTFRYYDQLSMSWLLRMRMKLIRLFPPAELLPVPGDSRTIDHYVGHERIADSKKITHIAILARRPGGVRLLNKDDARRMIFNLNRYEFAYMKSPMLTAYSYFNPEFDIQSLVSKEREILSRLIDNSTCLLVQSEDPTEFADLILKKIR
ncbi:MAG TPA: hypothetical protein VMX13_08350 [Sedimentisphaerales bacterium]|nr:hypothetical protein [Sedimentisphaerales bacterium]